MMTPDTLSLKLSRFMHITWLNKLLMLGLLSYIVIFCIYCLVNYPVQDLHKNTYGLATEFINLVIIVTVFWVVQCSQLAKKAYVFVSLGLILWIMGITAQLLGDVVILPYWISLYLDSFCRTIGITITAYGLFKTISFMQKMHNRLAQEFIIDDLTQVYNRRCFYKEVKNATAVLYTIIIIDIDHFKLINDDFGHDMGDKILKEFAQKINALFKNENLFARIGGEEFAGYFPSSNTGEIVQFCENILSVARTINIEDERFVSVSIGIAKNTQCEPFDSVIKRADQALYKAKNSGRDRFEIAL